MADVNPSENATRLNRKSFPEGFLFGTAVSAYQVEGAAYEDGKGKSIWDTFTKEHPYKIKDGSNGDIADDFYHRYKEDVKMLKNLGFDAFRFSISWSRILPTGQKSGGVNEKGIKFYNDLIDELQSNGITPFVTLFHWDLPQALDDKYGGFLSPQIVTDFCDFVELCFEKFGDRVKNWITLNEPWSYSVYGYGRGLLAPGRGSPPDPLSSPTLQPRSSEVISVLDSNILSTFQNPFKFVWGIYTMHDDLTTQQKIWNICDSAKEPSKVGDPGTEPYIVSHYQLLAHAAAVELYKKKFQESQEGKIGISLVTKWMVPYTDSKPHREAASRALDFCLGWFMDPLINGDYPNSMREFVGERLPKFSELDSEKLKGSFDFIGVNYYTATYVAHCEPNSDTGHYDTDAKFGTTRTGPDGKPIGEETGSEWLHIYPSGIYDLVRHTKEKYNNPLIYITENGMSDEKHLLGSEGVLLDHKRKKYHFDHLFYLHRAITDGVNVMGYFAWSFLDNFEWGSGFTERFGLIYVDYDDDKHLKRSEKESTKWFARFLKEDCDIWF